ncbi:hypothetical protein P7K49_002516 [Saguinus oedipus]|uniref:Uncharacterized protein n=1 Tax=Saguinus oedipus TaxID=9490 RepID=A0ABQ9WHJ1_SAGOE|nr:hypothetical protein P7K49_002516 [Saguinus oedipus]
MHQWILSCGWDAGSGMGLRVSHKPAHCEGLWHLHRHSDMHFGCLCFRKDPEKLESPRESRVKLKEEKVASPMENLRARSNKDAKDPTTKNSLESEFCMLGRLRALVGVLLPLEVAVWKSRRSAHLGHPLAPFLFYSSNRVGTGKEQLREGREGHGQDQFANNSSNKVLFKLT